MTEDPSECTIVTLKVKVDFGWDESKTNAKDAYYNAVGLAINPDFENVYDGAYLNAVTVMDEKGNVISEF